MPGCVRGCIACLCRLRHKRTRTAGRCCTLTVCYSTCVFPFHPARFTGADLYALCSDAWMTALKRAIATHEEAQRARQVQQLTAGEQQPHSDQQLPAAEEGSEEVEVTQEDFVAAADSLRPSLSAEEVAKYEAIRDSYAGQQRKRY